MPFSANGVGWTYYGQRDLGPDGSFITTEWFIVFHLPIFPLRSHRAISHGTQSVLGPFYQKEHYSLSKPMRPNVKQVLSTYAFACALVGLCVYVIVNYAALATKFGAAVVIGGIIASLFVFLLLPGFLRRWAIRRAGLVVVRRRRRR